MPSACSLPRYFAREAYNNTAKTIIRAKLPYDRGENFAHLILAWDAASDIISERNID
jgi:hypothetical protein